MNTRHRRHIERTIDSSAELLDHPGVATALSLSERVAGKLFLKRLFIPNVDSAGNITIPRSYRNGEHYPIVAARPGERLIAPDITPTPLQQQSAHEIFEFLDPLTVEPEQLVDHLLGRFAAKRSTTLSISPLHFAATQRPSITAQSLDYFENSEATKLHAIGKPYIIINPATTRRTIRRASSVLHEGVHVEQAIRDAVSPLPFDKRRRLVRDEFEGNQREAKIIIGATGRSILRKIAKRHSDADPVAVEMLREQYANPSNPLESTPQLMQALTNAGLADLVETPSRAS